MRDKVCDILYAICQDTNRGQAQFENSYKCSEAYMSGLYEFNHVNINHKNDFEPFTQSDLMVSSSDPYFRR